ncbi:MAG: Putative periplasmic ATP /GTP-binding protein [uncultured Sulfurovum sp.]|uniref:Periplasmic ATP /GTP-binding protein n=1 Tax=uncultured Sulfurovum sp. TaxID=269237 RepID=A0A6S6TM68_9BACT|nr:MAG: Putative periplasmic ATP /GTP-binding protein [uncultured Sulfurovum sp.]
MIYFFKIKYIKVNLLKNKSAFTMIELVFVIVVLGIIASLAMGRMDRDLQQEASETILSNIRLTQQLALRDNKHSSNSGWQQAYWQFYLRPCGLDWSYRVSSNIGLETAGVASLGKAESAINPIDGKYLWATNCTDLNDDESPSVLLSKKFGIDTIISTPSCRDGNSESTSIAFDYLGRPHVGSDYDGISDFRKIMLDDCNITFTMSTDQNNDDNMDSFTITIKKETGHAFIIGQESL